MSQYVIFYFIKLYSFITSEEFYVETDWKDNECIRFCCSDNFKLYEDTNQDHLWFVNQIILSKINLKYT